MKYALVTGGSRGIGRAVCIKLARMGYHVLINYASRAEEAQKTLELVREAGQDGEILPFDVCRHEQVCNAIDEWEKAHPDEYIEVLVNNAGIRSDSVLAFMPGKDWHRVVEVCLTGFYNVTQAVLQPMLVHKYGRIINIASTRYLMSEPGSEGYAASKGGIRSLTHALALSLAPLHVTVNSIAPGWIEHANYEGLRPEDHAQHPSGRVGRPEDIARLCLFLCAEANDFIDGENITVDGGMTRKMIYVE